MKNLYLLLVLFVNKKIQYTRLPFFIYTDSVRKNEKRAPKKETDQEPWPRQYVLVLLIAAYTATSERGYRQEMRPSTLPVKNDYLEMAMLAQTDGTMKTVA